jgi:hypothetical protein
MVPEGFGESTPVTAAAKCKLERGAAHSESYCFQGGQGYPSFRCSGGKYPQPFSGVPARGKGSDAPHPRITDLSSLVKCWGHRRASAPYWTIGSSIPRRRICLNISQSDIYLVGRPMDLHPGCTITPRSDLRHRAQDGTDPRRSREIQRTGWVFVRDTTAAWPAQSNLYRKADTWRARLRRSFSVRGEQ